MNDPSAAEFENDCRALDAALSSMLDGGDPAEHLAAAELVRKFYVKHRGRLEADEIDVTTFLREFTEQARVYGGAVEAEDRAMDAYLQERAKQAEAAAQLTEAEFKILRHFESMSEADWAAGIALRTLSRAARNSFWYSGDREYLVALPIEKRRQEEGL